jgi:hypothetical protein
MAGSKIISSCMLAKKEKVLVFFQYVLKNTSKNYGAVFPYFGENKNQSLDKIQVLSEFSRKIHRMKQSADDLNGVVVRNADC